MKDLPVVRVMGSEVEYGYRLAPGDKQPLGSSDRKFPLGIRYKGDFLENGARLYMDPLGFPEYASGEALTLDELVMHELAGERIIFSTYGEGKSRAKTLHKRSISPDGQFSNGAHENYLTRVNIWKGTDVTYNLNALASYNATRTILTGAGLVTPKGFVIGQKIQDIETVVNMGTTRNKPLINTRGEHHAGGTSELYRLHVTSGDSNLSPLAIRMKFGMYSLNLRLLEHGVDVHDLFLKDPLKAAYIAGGSVKGMFVPLDIADSDKTMTAINIQEEYVTRVAALTDQLAEEGIALPQGEVEVIDIWRRQLDSLKLFGATDEIQTEMKQMDWATKYELLARRREKRKGKNFSDGKNFAIDQAYDLAYDNIDDGVGVRLRRQPNRFAKHTPSDEVIQEALTTPPAGRAEVRGTFIKQLFERRKLEQYAYVDWANLKYGSSSRNRDLNPTAVYTKENIREFIDEIFDESEA